MTYTKNQYLLYLEIIKSGMTYEDACKAHQDGLTSGKMKELFDLTETLNRAQADEIDAARRQALGDYPSTQAIHWTPKEPAPETYHHIFLQANSTIDDAPDLQEHFGHMFAGGRLPKVGEEVRMVCTSRSEEGKSHQLTIGLEVVETSAGSPIVECNGQIFFQLSSAYANPPTWTDLSKDDYADHVNRDGWLTRIVHASPPAPASVVLPERRSFDQYDHVEKRAAADGWNKCIDKVKELNQ
jgi:hypothetical protein